ncbi:MAG: hypothetical protein C0508_05125 [Cyanobacteria bacterium PR.023]|nr:hypothetical protein [Cyanobacteria bacterium PR.3.49]MBA4074404.1 hypothetical protein [Cyanobacteria bacterium PR.023]
MENLYSRLLDLLGKRYTDPIFPQFIADIGEQPDDCNWSDPVLFNKFDTPLVFYKSGHFSLRFRYGVAHHIVASINTPMIRSGEVRPFEGLPAGIVASDSRSEIEAKLKTKPFSSTEGRYDAYYIEPYVLTFNFENERLFFFEIEFRP